MLLSEEAADVKDSAEKVKRALEEAQRAQTAASSAIQQAAADIQNTNNLLSSVSAHLVFISDIIEIMNLHKNIKITCFLTVLLSGAVRDGRCRIKTQ